MAIHLTGLRVDGRTKRPAEISFVPGLNVICGASDTGKTYIQQCLDFMLGKKDPPKDIPESYGYGRALLSMASDESSEITLVRSLEGGAFKKYAGGIPAVLADSKYEELGSKHDADSESTVSHLLLSESGLAGRRVRKDKFGKTNSLSFRNLAFLNVIDETKIISSISPVFTGQYTTKTAEESVFKLLLLGTDDSDLVADSKPEDAKARINAQLMLLGELIKTQERRLRSAQISREQLKAAYKKIDREISTATEVNSTLQAEISKLEKRRADTWASLYSARERIKTVRGLMARFELLEMHYGSDRSRLEAVVEAENAIAIQPEVICKACGKSLSEPRDATETKELRRACEAEVGKISLLERDLRKTTAVLRAEALQLEKDESSLSQSYSSVSTELLSVVKPRERSGHSVVSAMINERERIARSLEIHNEIDILIKKKGMLTEALGSIKKPKGIKPRVHASSVEDFSLRVEALLKSWKYPSLGRVTWDTEARDFIIGGKRRGDLGKGYRAFTHAAFTVGLMTYCLEKGLSHPGFVVLDTPLNPLREADEGPSGKISTAMKDAFYSTLAEGATKGQVIVLENYPPPSFIEKGMNYIPFTKKPGVGRYGFFPHIS